jgi:Nif-specific regulatory protein
VQIKDSLTGEDLLKSNIADFEKHIIVSALKRTGGNQRKAARQLGTTVRILRYRVQKYNIDIRVFQMRRKAERTNTEKELDKS